MAEEILNIDYHTKRLIVKALNKSATHEKAAKALGISERNLFRLKKQYNIEKVQRYEIVENKRSKK
jgi:transcriptional regulator with PAS, ATPase and Fis domain